MRTIAKVIGAIRKAILLAVAGILWFVCPVCSAESYSVGVVPQYEARALASAWVPILAELSRRTGLQFSMKGSPRIPEFEIAFEAGEFDFAYMNPYHALIAARRQGYIPLVRDAEPLYGVVAVRKDSTYKAIGELAGKKISFPAPNAFGASLLIRADIERVFHTRIVPLYAQTHTSTYLNTLLGVSEASGGVKASFDLQKPDIRDGLRIIYETSRVPSHPILAHPRVPPEHRDRVRKALLDMAATPEGVALLAKIPMTQVVPATASDYTALEKLNLEKFYVKSGD